VAKAAVKTAVSNQQTGVVIPLALAPAVPVAAYYLRN